VNNSDLRAVLLIQRARLRRMIEERKQDSELLHELEMLWAENRSALQHLQKATVFRAEPRVVGSVEQAKT
jgi:hypothetical protein